MCLQPHGLEKIQIKAAKSPNKHLGNNPLLLQILHPKSFEDKAEAVQDQETSPGRAGTLAQQPSC